MVNQPDKYKLHEEWRSLMSTLETMMGKKPKDLNAVIFLIGIQELGKGPQEFSKEEKQDLMHVALCKIFEPEGYYQLEGYDQDGWPHYELRKPLPHKNIVEQVSFMRIRILNYFRNQGII